MTLTFLMVLGSYLALSLGMVISYGHYSFSAFLMTGISLLGLIFAIFVSSKEEKADSTSSQFLKVGLGVGIFFSLILFVASPTLIYSTLNPRFLFLPFMLIEATFVFFLFHFRENSKKLLILFILILIVWIIFSLLVLQVSPHPAIDVWYQGQGAAQALLSGENPYSKIFSMPIQSEEYQVTYLYPYPPYSLLISTPFYYLLGDVRYANIFCQLIAALLLFKISQKINSDRFIAILISALFLFNPRWPFVLEQAWTESSFIILLFASVLLFLNSSFNWGNFFSGIFIAAKPYLLPFILPFLKFSSSRKRSWMILLFSLFLIPFGFILWSPHDFYHNVIDYHFKSPFRLDSLNLSAFLARNFSFFIPSWISFVAFCFILVGGVLKKSLFKSFLYLTFAYFIFFWLSKQAFCNYYFFVEGLLLLTLALLPIQRLSSTKYSTNPL